LAQSNFGLIRSNMFGVSLGKASQGAHTYLPKKLHQLSEKLESCTTVNKFGPWHLLWRLWSLWYFETLTPPGPMDHGARDLTTRDHQSQGYFGLEEGSKLVT
ncbi:hypothetical protein THAOC_35027, partial [Thalassiosira oceanica]